MGLTVQLPVVLAQVVGERSIALDPTPPTVEEAFKLLFGRYPALAREMLGPDGKIDHTYGLFLNGERISQWQEQDRPLREGDELVILMMLAGG
ncbi:MAG: MoaD/ThiS family protein [Clostridia bacterium]|nr:MoaD/ThiS family protein [Clostridia bacterium]